tara:strand:+ start:3647 stop:5719 length:2073 start_codon:yes stop_codon:yes gene_type:complete
MGTAYDSRNDSSNNIADGNVINAADLDGEFDAILAAFGTGGHSHDGTAGEGGAIEKIGPSQQFLTDSGSFYPSAGSLDLGKSGNKFDNIFVDNVGADTTFVTTAKAIFRNSDIYIHSGADNHLDLVADGEIHLTSPTVNIDASSGVDISATLTVGTDATIGDDLTMGSDGAIINFGTDSDIVLTHVADTGLKLSSVTAGNLLHLQSTEAGTSAGPVVIIERDSASPADNDFGGSILFKADSDTGTSRNIAKITTQVKDVSNGTEDSEVIFSNIVAGTETAQITLGTGITFGTALTINSGINVDDFNIDGTTIALSSGDMTLDTAGDIILDADGDEVIFKNGSTNIGHVSMDSSNLTVKSLVSDKDMVFKGNDGGSEVTALTLDMSEAGDASFGRNVTIGGNLTVSGTTTQIDSTVTTIADPIITLGANASDDNKDRGIEFKYNDGSARVGFFGYDDSEAKFTLLTAATNSSEVFSGTTGTLVANLEGNTTGLHTGTVKASGGATFTLPSSDGSNGQFLKTNGSGTLSFATVSTTTDLTSDVTGVLPVANGGTGVSSITANKLLTGNGTSAMTVESGLTYDGSTFTVSGTVSATEVTATSDERLKSDIQTIDNALYKVMSMRGVTYTMQAEKGTGVIAQEVEKILPEVVVDNEYKSVAYGNMVGVLIEAIKDLKKEIDEHKQGCKCHGSSD